MKTSINHPHHFQPGQVVHGRCFAPVRRQESADGDVLEVRGEVPLVGGGQDKPFTPAPITNCDISDGAARIALIAAAIAILCAGVLVLIAVR